MTFCVLYVFVLLRHDWHRVARFNTTAHPTAAWPARQSVEAFPRDLIVFGEDRLRRVLGSCVAYHYRSRTHGGSTEKRCALGEEGID